MKKRPNPTELINKVSSKLGRDLPQYPDFKAGDTIRVYVKVIEGEKTRIQPFEGVVIKKTKGGVRASFIVRKISNGVGVERIFPLHSPVIDRIMLVSQGEVRRAKLYYLRALRGRKGRIKSEYVYQDTVMDTPEETKPSDDTDKLGASDVSAKAAQG